MQRESRKKQRWILLGGLLLALGSLAVVVGWGEDAGWKEDAGSARVIAGSGVAARDPLPSLRGRPRAKAAPPQGHGSPDGAEDVSPPGSTDPRSPAEPGGTMTLEGRVVYEGGGAASGASVWLETRFATGVPRRDLAGLRARADAEGRFSIPGVPAREHGTSILLCARTKAAASVRQPIQSMLLTHGETPRQPGDFHEIVLPRPAWLVVEVVTERGEKPVAGCTVRADAFTEGVTNEAGEVRLGPLAPGAHALEAKAKGYCFEPYGQSQAEVPSSGVGHHRLIVREGCAIGCRVFYPDGTPADDRSFGIGIEGPRYQMGTTMGNGTFHRDCVPKDDYEVRVYRGDMESTIRPDAADLVVGRGYVRAGQTDARVVLDVRRAVPLEIRVFDGAGGPLRAGSVLLTPRTRDEDILGGLWTRAPPPITDGRAVVEGLDTTVWLTIVPEDGAWARQRLGPVAPGTGFVEIALQTGLEIAGEVLDGRGAPVEGVIVYLWPDATPTVFVDRGIPLVEARTGEDGRFRFDRIPAGGATLDFRVPDGYCDVDDVHAFAGNDNVRIEVRAREECILKVVGPDGVPVAGAQIATYEPPWYSHGRPQARTDERGRAVVRGLDPLVCYGLRVEPPPGAVGLLPYSEHDWTPVSGTMVLPSALTVRGRVLGPTGVPEPMAVVQVLRNAGPGVTELAADREGRFSFESEPGGSVEVRARALGGRGSDWTLVDPQHPEVELVLHPRRGVLRVRVEGWPMAEVPAAPSRVGPACRYWREDRPEVVHQAPVSRDGTVEIEALDATGRYACFLRHPQHRQVVALLRDAVPDGSLHRIRPAPPRVLRGRLHLPEHAHFGRVAVRQADVVVERLEDEEPATYAVEGLPESRWTLDVWISRAGIGERQTVVADGLQVPDVFFPER